jgi:hypothetical protein
MVPLSQGLVALVDAEDYERVISAGKWSAHVKPHTTYAVRNIVHPDGRRGMQKLHAFLTGFPETDHRNRNGLDNRRANLRRATRSENLQNRGPQSNNKSGYKGVSWDAPRSKWVSRIKAGGVYRYLGRFSTAEQAARAYDAAATECFGDFAHLNLPQGVNRG